MSKVIRVDAEVKAALDAERRPGERNYNPAIMRLTERHVDYARGSLIREVFLRQQKP